MKNLKQNFNLGKMALVGFIFMLCSLFVNSVFAQWSVTGNAGTNPATNFVGTTDAKSLLLKTSNILPPGLGAEIYLQYSTSNRFVGINTTSPNYQLQVDDPVNSSSYIQFTNSSTGNGATDGLLVGTNGGDAIINLQETAHMYFYTAGTQRMKIDKTGLVGIGTSSPQQSLHVATNGSMVQMRMERTGSSTGIAEMGCDAGNLHLFPGGYTSGSHSVFQANGMTGIGTGSPAATLHVKDPLAQVQLRLERASGVSDGIADLETHSGDLTIYPGGYSNNHPTTFKNDGTVGIGTGSPGATLHVKDKLAQIQLRLERAAGSSDGIVDLETHSGGLYIYPTGYVSCPSDQSIVIRNDGTVGIGTGSAGAATGFKLDVSGAVHACEVKVDMSGCDFVFGDNYKLMPLPELEKFVSTNKHLPEVASAKEMESGSGVAIGELQSKLLQKVEELTLYMIEMEKQNKELTCKVAELENSKNQK